MPLSVQGYHGALYVNPADMTMLSPSRIQVLEEQGRARIAAESAAKDVELEAHMKQKYGENFDCKLEFYPSPTIPPSGSSHPKRHPLGSKKVVNSAIVGRKDRGRYDRFVDSAWGKLQETKRSRREKSAGSTNRL